VELISGWEDLKRTKLVAVTGAELNWILFPDWNICFLNITPKQDLWDGKSILQRKVLY